MALYEANPSDLTTGLTITVGTAGYLSTDGKDNYGRGTLSSEDFLRVSDNAPMGYKLYEILVDGNDIHVIICGEQENGTVLRPWAAGISLNADAAGAVAFAASSTHDYSYSATNAGLAAALAADVTSLVVLSLTA